MNTNTNFGGAEWRAIIERLMPVGERMTALMPDSQDPQLRQEMYRQLFAGMSMAHMAMSLGDAEHPDFWPVINQAFPFMGPNPDDTYYMAAIDGLGEYRISGHRGTVRLVDVQFGSGSFFTRGSEQMGPNTASYDLDSLAIEADGSFDVIVSPTRPEGYDGNWWPLAPSTNYVLVRQVAYDWAREIDGRFAIDRLDRPAIRPRPDAKQIEADLIAMTNWGENWARAGLRFVSRYRSMDLVNKVYVHDLADVGGVATQKYVEGQFELEPDEALIYETEIPERCRYWNLQLTDLQWAGMDYTNRQTSLNGHTAVLDRDGRFRAVISAADPGVPNWLDTAGHRRGALLGRWTESSSAPTPTITRIRLADAHRHLPADTATISAPERDAAIRARRKAAQLRRRW